MKATSPRNFWLRLEPLLPPEKPVGRHRNVGLREVLNGIFYVLGKGCYWG
ncbi:MAG: hypothetical protein BRC34_07295 [Cyanobacteria bacterium QH_1_48_107]|nr:MAG: hypothetical protein BRC34_07295 [Cyanobacteria bacterium QH_1_48_107]